MLTFKYALYYSIESAKKLWQGIDLKRWSENIGGSSAEYVLAAFYFVIAFGLGYFLRSRLKFMFGSLVVCFLLIKIMEYNNLARVDWNAIRFMLGIGGNINTAFANALAWIQSHILLSVAAVVGFLIGAKLG